MADSDTPQHFLFETAPCVYGRDIVAYHRGYSSSVIYCNFRKISQWEPCHYYILISSQIILILSYFNIINHHRSSPPSRFKMDDLPMGTRLPLGTRRKEENHPSNRGRPYSQDSWEQVLAVYLNAGGGAAGLEALRTEVFEDLRAVKKFSCMLTCRRYIHQWHNEGNILSKLHTGNKFSQREIHGDDLFHLVLYWIAFPKVIGAEVRAILTLLPSFVEQRRDWTDHEGRICCS